jgi:hypothetical protein
MTIALAVSTLSNISFFIRRLEFNLARLKVFNIKYVFVVRGRFEVHEEQREGELG